MSFFDDDAAKPVKRAHLIGQDLSLLSVEEIDERIDQLREEIGRLEAERAAKGTTRDAADALFRKD